MSLAKRGTILVGDESMWKALFGWHRFVSLLYLSLGPLIFSSRLVLLLLSCYSYQDLSWDQITETEFWLTQIIIWTEIDVIICYELPKLYHSVCSPRRRDRSGVSVDKNVPWVVSIQRAGWFLLEEVMSGQAPWNMSSTIMPFIFSKMY